MGDKTHLNYQQRQHTPGYILNAQGNGFMRDAVATGSILVDGVNLIPEPSTWAQLDHSSTHFIEIARNVDGE